MSRSVGRAIGFDVHRDLCEVAICEAVWCDRRGDTGIRQARAQTDRLDARTPAKLLAAGESSPRSAIWDRTRRSAHPHLS